MTIVRDRFVGRDMARVMSLTMMIFIIVPVFAPSIGSLLLTLGIWHVIFAATLALGICWRPVRCPHAGNAAPGLSLSLSLARVGQAMRLTVSTRVSIGYHRGRTDDGLPDGLYRLRPADPETSVYSLGPVFTVYFGVIAATMAIGSLVNSRLVRRVGMRRMAHAGICAFAAVAVLQFAGAAIYSGHPPLAWFVTTLSLNLMLFSVTVPNFNAMAMEPLGAIAGTASSFIGAYTTLAGALLGFAVGQAFNGTVTPLAAGFVLYSLACVAVVLWTERGRLFVPRNAPPPAAR